MTIRRGKRHELTIDGQTVWLDSLNEAIALQRFIDKYGFSDKWVRPTYGVKHAGKYYSPDFELAVNDYSHTSRALIEVKQYRRDFTKNMVERMCAVASHYNTKHLFLYTVKNDKWYKVYKHNGMLQECSPPSPGTINLHDLFMPKRYLVRNWYGRRYYQGFSDGAFSLLRNVLTPAKPRRHRYRKQ